MLKRPHSFSDIIGHDIFKNYLIERITKGNLPRFLIFVGALGLGKTSLAEIVAITLNYGFDDSEEKSRAIAEVIDNHRSTDCIKLYNMAKDSGKDTAKEVLSELTAVMSPTGKKVVICDECHAISESAQDVFLVETEFIQDNVYLIMCTTDIGKLKPTLVSRAAVIPLKQLTTSQMLTVLNREVTSRGLRIQGGDTTLRMIAEWADNKPRAAMNMLNAFGENEYVTTETIREFIGYLDVNELLPLISTLAGSMTYGLSYISEMKISDSIIDLLIEILRIKLGQPSFKISVSDLQKVRSAVENVPEIAIMKFLHKLAGAYKLNKSVIISAYLYAHTAYDRMFKNDPLVLSEELTQKMSRTIPSSDILKGQRSSAPTMEDLMADSKIVEGL